MGTPDRRQRAAQPAAERAANTASIAEQQTPAQLASCAVGCRPAALSAGDVERLMSGIPENIRTMPMAKKVLKK